MTLEGAFGPDETYPTFKLYAQGELEKISVALEKTKKNQKKFNEDSVKSVKDVNKEV